MDNKGKYHLVNSESPEDVQLEKLLTPTASSKNRRYAWFWIILSYISGALSLFCLLHTYRWIRNPLHGSIIEGMDYDDLAKENMTVFYDKFNDRYDWVNSTGDPYWEDIQNHFGIVMVHHEWARKKNLIPTSAHPYEPEYDVYQIDGFHALHCVDFLRRRIVKSNDTATSMPLNFHIAHCIDFLRQHLMCHVDLSMSASPQSVFFTIDPPHKCQDFEAIHQWAERHAWADFLNYFDEHKPDDA